MKTYMNTIKSEVVTITPEIAKLWLTIYNKRNRKLNKRRVNKYVRDIEAGLWKLNGESIKISDQNILLDGQHRLEAVVQSGKSIESVVITNIPASNGVFESIDAGMPRSATDAMRLDGMSYACLIPAIIRMVADYGWDQTWERSMSSIEVKSIIDMDYNSWVAAAEASEEMKTTCVPSVWGAFYYMASKQWPESIKLFHNRISRMTNISDGSPVIALNRVLMQFKGKTRKDNGKTRADKIQMIEKCIVAFNAHLQQQNLYRITLGKKRAEILK